MTLVIFYSLAILFGFILMFLFNKFFEDKKKYYIAWVIFIIILLSISSIMGESIYYIFESENYSELPSWVYVIFILFILIPTSFLLYPIVLAYRWFFGTLEELFLSIMLLFISKKRKIEYYNSIKEHKSNQT